MSEPTITLHFSVFTAGSTVASQAAAVERARDTAARLGHAFTDDGWSDDNTRDYAYTAPLSAAADVLAAVGGDAWGCGVAGDPDDAAYDAVEALCDRYGTDCWPA